MKKINPQTGFTLVEIMIYFAITSVFLFAIAAFALRIIDASRLAENINEIQASGNFSTDKVVEKIHSASSLDSGNSIFDNDSGKLALIGSPNVSFYLENRNVYMTEGTNNPVKLNSSAVQVNKLKFHLVRAEKTPDQIVIDGEFQSMPNISSLAHIFVFHLSVSLRK